MDNSVLQLGLLRAVRDDELDIMLEWRNAPGVRKYMYTQHVIGRDEHLEWWSTIRKCFNKKYFMYEYDGIPQGVVSFSEINLSNKNSSWAFFASPSAPKGIGSYMEFLAIEYAFKEIQLHKLSCEVLMTNVAVIKLHQKFGFKVEGVFREQYVLDDKFLDVCRLGLLAPEWAKQREALQKKLLEFLRRGRG